MAGNPFNLSYLGQGRSYIHLCVNKKKKKKIIKVIQLNMATRCENKVKVKLQTEQLVTAETVQSR